MARAGNAVPLRAPRGRTAGGPRARRELNRPAHEVGKVMGRATGPGVTRPNGGNHRRPHRNEGNHRSPRSGGRRPPHEIGGHRGPRQHPRPSGNPLWGDHSPHGRATTAVPAHGGRLPRGKGRMPPRPAAHPRERRARGTVPGRSAEGVAPSSAVSVSCASRPGGQRSTTTISVNSRAGSSRRGGTARAKTGPAIPRPVPAMAGHSHRARRRGLGPRRVGATGELTPTQQSSPTASRLAACAPAW